MIKTSQEKTKTKSNHAFFQYLSHAIPCKHRYRHQHNYVYANVSIAAVLAGQGQIQSTSQTHNRSNNIIKDYMEGTYNVITDIGIN